MCWEYLFECMFLNFCNAQNLRRLYFFSWEYIFVVLQWINPRALEIFLRISFCEHLQWIIYAMLLFFHGIQPWLELKGVCKGAATRGCKRLQVFFLGIQWWLKEKKVQCFFPRIWWWPKKRRRGYKFLFMSFNHGGFGVHKKNLMIVLCVIRTWKHIMMRVFENHNSIF
jgi:hypothetical protein